MKILLILLLFFAVSCAGIRGRYHRVGAGESIAKIAATYGVSRADLEDHNGSRLNARMKPGMKIYIPFESRSDWDEDLVSESRAIAASDDRPYTVEAVRFSWPVRGFISSAFGKRRHEHHEGIDIVARGGTPVKAARSGHVIYVDNRIGGYGNMVIVRHSDAFSTVYAHLSRFDVKKGQFVRRGQLIGRVGKTGRATNYHLHFEIRNDRVPVNPLLYLQGQVATNILAR